MFNMPWTIWMDPLFGPGNEEPQNEEGYKTDMCDALCPGYTVVDPTGGFGHEQEWAHTVPACEDSQWGLRCYIEDKAAMSGLGDEREDRGWSLTSTYAGGRTNPMARLCPCSDEPPQIPCDGGVTLTDGGDIFQPQYDNNQDCSWLLTCSDPNLAPQVTFTDFHTEGSWDFVYVYDGADLSSHIAVTLHGNLGDGVEQITGSTSSVLLRLVTDGSVLAGGFTGSYTCEAAVPAGPPDPCDGDPVVMTDGGEFFHSTLSADQECRWQLVCSDNTLSPRIIWTAFDLENAFDHVYLKENGNTLSWLNNAGAAPGSATATLTGTEIPDVWTDMYNNPCCDSSTGVLYLSDGSVDGLGFVGSFECVDNTIPYVPAVAGCTNPTAQNYLPGVDIDDGSCICDPTAAFRGPGAYTAGSNTAACAACSGDMDGDMVVGTRDLLLLLSDFDLIDCRLISDANGDCVVNTPDLLALLAAFGTDCIA
jgi:hypothetical protein